MRRNRLRLLTGLAVATAAVLATAIPAAASTSAPALPNSMASTGDSITRGFDSTASGCFLSDCPQYSWSTGDSSTVNSQYRRILANNPAISGKNYNDAKTGAKMDALNGQLTTAAGQTPDYVTVLMGANDLCTSSKSTMTPTATFQSEFQTALTNFFQATPNAHVFVSSIPNIYQLWSLLHNNGTAEWVWGSFGICQSMLSQSNTEADRQAVVAQENADNTVLANVCAQFANCKWDNLTTYNYVFSTSDVSTVDYFHPSLSGQDHLAGATWSASYWPTLAAVKKAAHKH